MLRSIKLARTSAEAGTNTAFSAVSRRCCSSASEDAPFADQSDLTTLTTTLVPSLLIATVSDRRTSATICERPA